ncbi:unnamed protein product [Rotaria sordida]|uniref:F-box domain-containing protein n=1 Tax=Rotaria sordida TaxID=392033 RepID=A0A815NRW0_9BILA|nr:unnamed protein product [Rotaria sordida]
MFEFLSIDVLYEICAYLSPVDILRSLASLNKRFSTIFMYQFLWHIHIDGDRMSLLTFNDFCENILKVVRHRVVSLRITFKHVVGGWSLVSSALKYHQTMLLRHVQLIDIQPYEFDKFLCNHLTKQLHTLIVDVTEHNPFNYQDMEGAYLAKVCSCLPALTICRLPFNFCRISRKKLLKSSTTPLMSLPNVFNTTYLHTLTVGVNTSRFLEHLLPCIPFIQNLSIGIADPVVIEDDGFDIVSMPVAVDARLLRNLIKSFDMDAESITLRNGEYFCKRISNRLPDLKHFSFSLHNSHDEFGWHSSNTRHGQITCTERIVNHICYLLDHFQQLVSLDMSFVGWTFTATPCFSYLIRRQLHELLLNRPYRVRCSEKIQIWL